MAGYADTRELIINTLMGRPAGTEIQPEDHQAFALQITEYIRQVELVAGSGVPVAFAEPDTVPVQPDNGQAVYLSYVPRSVTKNFVNFINQSGNSISVTSSSGEVKLVTLLWNGSYWSSQIITIDVLSDDSSVNASNIGASDYILFSTSSNYSIGDIVRYDGKLYKFTTEHAAGTWNGTDVELASINSILTSKLTELDESLYGEGKQFLINKAVYGKGIIYNNFTPVAGDIFKVEVLSSSEQFYNLRAYTSGEGSNPFVIIIKQDTEQSIEFTIPENFLYFYCSGNMEVQAFKEVNKGDIVTLKSDNVTLKSDVVTLKSDNVTLKSDNVTLKSDVVTLKSDNVTLKSDNVTLKSDVVTLKSDVAEIQDVVFPRKILLAEYRAYAKNEELFTSSDVQVGDVVRIYNDVGGISAAGVRLYYGSQIETCSARHESAYVTIREGFTKATAALNSNDNYIYAYIANNEKNVDFQDLSADNTQITYSTFFHDNFERTANDWHIGSNSDTQYVDKFAYIQYGEDIDDGFRISAITKPFSLSSGKTLTNDKTVSPSKGFRFIKNMMSLDNIVVSMAYPRNIGKYQSLVYNFTDADNFRFVEVVNDTNDGFVVKLCRYTNGEYSIERIFDKIAIDGMMIRLHFSKGCIRLLVDDAVVDFVLLPDVVNSIGLMVTKDKDYEYSFVNIAEVKGMSTYDNSNSIDNGFEVPFNTDVDAMTNKPLYERIGQNDNAYAIEIINERKVERFTTKFSQTTGVSDDRSEIEFVKNRFYNLTKYIVSFDFMIPTFDTLQECIYQTHHSYNGTVSSYNPSISLRLLPTNDGTMKLACMLASVYSQLSTPSQSGYNVNETHDIIDIETGRWYHVELLVRQGYIPEHNPLTIVRVDGKDMFKSTLPNCFNEYVAEFPKYGMYKSIWATSGNPHDAEERTVYFDNVVIKC